MTFTDTFSQRLTSRAVRRETNNKKSSTKYELAFKKAFQGCYGHFVNMAPNSDVRAGTQLNVRGQYAVRKAMCNLDAFANKNARN